jgi:hypothetical protein
MSSWIFFTQIRSFKQATIHSDVGNIQVTIQDEEKLNEFIDSWGIYSKKITLVRTEAKLVDIRSVNIILSPLPQYLDTFLGVDHQTIIQSSGHSYKRGVLTVYVYLHPNQILERDEKEISSWILYTSLLRLYSIANNEKIDKEKFSTQISSHVETAHEIINVKKN